MKEFPKKTQNDMIQYIQLDLEEKMLSDRLNQIKSKKDNLFQKHFEVLKRDTFYVKVSNENLNKTFVFNVETSSKSSTPYKELLSKAVLKLRTLSEKVANEFEKEIQLSKKQNAPVSKLKLTEF